MYTKILNLSLVPGHIHQGEMGALYGLVALAAALDQSAPSSGNAVDVCVARIVSQIETITGVGTAKLLGEKMKDYMSDLREKLARGEV